MTVVLLSSVTHGLSAAAEESPSDCHAFVDPTGRLLCYDRVTRRPEPSGASAGPSSDTPLRGAPPDHTANAPAPVSASAPAASETPTPSTRGLSAPPSVEAPVEASPLIRVEQTSIGRYRFHLGNGEVWEQLEAGRISVREGDLVNVRQTTFGSWQLRDAASTSRSVRVRRVE